MVTGMGIAALICGGLSAILWLPGIWVWWIAIFGVLCGIAGVVLGYLSNMFLQRQLPAMQQQAAAYGQPFRKPFEMGKLGMALGGAGLILNAILVLGALQILARGFYR